MVVRIVKQVMQENSTKIQLTMADVKIKLKHIN